MTLSMSLLGQLLGRLHRLMVPGVKWGAGPVRALAALFSVCALFLLPACSGPGEKADIVIINGAEPGTLDPALITVQTDGRVGRSLFEGLTRLDPKSAKPLPAIAESWDISPDGTV